jgi:lysophospholipase L1-like esterase
MARTTYRSYVAIGDSFSEGLEDRRPDGTYRGWADLVAAELAAREPGFRYANLAVRGRRLHEIREVQVPAGTAMDPDLITLAGGGNDIIGFRCDVPALARSFRELMAHLATTRATVLVFTGYDPRGRLPMSRVLASRAGAYNAAITAAADEYGALLVDLWRLDELYHDRNWARDRLHLSPQGHALIAATVLRTLGVPGPYHQLAVAEVGGADDRTVRARLAWLTARRADAVWVRSHLAPWVGRKLRGRSTGDGVLPKHPELTALVGHQPVEQIDLRTAADRVPRGAPPS